jgi:NAD+ diphosphatase
MGISRNPNIFANNPLDRASYRRTDAAWIAAQIADSQSLFVPFYRLQPFVLPEEKPGAGKDVGWLRMGLLRELAGPSREPLFAGPE